MDFPLIIVVVTDFGEVPGNWVPSILPPISGWLQRAGSLCGLHCVWRAGVEAELWSARVPVLIQPLSPEFLALDAGYPVTCFTLWDTGASVGLVQS